MLGAVEREEDEMIGSIIIVILGICLLIFGIKQKGSDNKIRKILDWLKIIIGLFVIIFGCFVFSFF